MSLCDGASESRYYDDGPERVCGWLTVARRRNFVESKKKLDFRHAFGQLKRVPPSDSQELTKKAIVAGRAKTRRRAQRDSLWADADAVTYRPKETGGWAQMPRTVPMIAGLIDRLGGKFDAGRLYVCLFALEYGDGFVEVPDPSLLAIEAGYKTTRGERTFTERMNVLRDLGFIRSARLGTREFGFVLLVDPHRVVARIYSDRPEAVGEDWWTAFLSKCANIGVSPPTALVDTSAPASWTVALTYVHPDPTMPSVADRQGQHYDATTEQVELAALLLAKGGAAALVSLGHGHEVGTSPRPRVMRIWDPSRPHEDRSMT
jgi:hypothetical protein